MLIPRVMHVERTHTSSTVVVQVVVVITIGHCGAAKAKTVRLFITCIGKSVYIYCRDNP